MFSIDKIPLEKIPKICCCVYFRTYAFGLTSSSVASSAFAVSGVSILSAFASFGKP